MFSKTVFKENVAGDGGCFSLRLEYPAPGLCSACDRFFENLILQVSSPVPDDAKRSVCADMVLSFANDELCSLFWDIISYTNGLITGYSRFSQLWDIASDRLVRLPAFVKTKKGIPLGASMKNPDGFYVTSKELCLYKIDFAIPSGKAVRRSDCRKFLQEEKCLLSDCGLLAPYNSFLS